MKYAVSLFLLILIFTGCSSFRRVDIDKEHLLDNHLKMWEDFRIDGIVEFSYRQLRLRKNISLSLNKESFNMTVYDRGIFGLSPKPFLTVRIDSMLSLDMPAALSSLVEDDIFSAIDMSIDDIFNGLSTVKANKRRIIRDGRLDLDNTTLVFNERMQIEQIISEFDEVSLDEVNRGNAAKLTVKLDYDRSESLSNIGFYHRETVFMSINVDRMTLASTQ